MSNWADLENLNDLGGVSAKGEAPVHSELGGIFESCRKCAGTGRVRWGMCFACQGKGGKTFKTDAATRASSRAADADRKVRKAENNWNAYATANSVAAAWISANTGKFEFATAMSEAVRKYGSLTEKQQVAVDRCIACDADRAEQAKARVANAPVIDVAPVADYFARQRGFGHYKLRLDTFIFSPAGSASANMGAIYVKEGEQYLGKIMGGKFLGSRECTPDQSVRILAAAADPLNAARAYGKRFGVCSVCGRTLSDPVSIANGIGPICEAGFGY